MLPQPTSAGEAPSNSDCSTESASLLVAEHIAENLSPADRRPAFPGGLAPGASGTLFGAVANGIYSGSQALRLSAQPGTTLTVEAGASGGSTTQLIVSLSGYFVDAQ